MDKLSKGKSNFENVLPSQNCVFGRAGLGFNPQNKKDKFSKNFPKQPVNNRLLSRNNRLLHAFIA